MVTITISGADKTGALFRLTSFFARKGYRVTGNQMTPSASGAKLLKISLDVTQIDKDRLSAEIKGLDPNFGVVSVAIEGAASTAVTIKEIASQFPDIAPLVKAYGESFGAGRDKELLEAGRKIGAFHYEKEWSFGSPLKMPVALRRALVPALENFGRVDATDTSVALPDSPFCARQVSCCEFLTGFMQGFLDAGPLTQNTRVKKAACRARGDAHCSYAIEYDL